MRLGFLNEAKLKSSQRSDFGLPSKNKYPMPDRTHVLAAIRMFNHVSPGRDERELAQNIKIKMQQYGISPNQVGDKNRLKKYLGESAIFYDPWDIRPKDLRNIQEGLRLRRRYRRMSI